MTTTRNQIKARIQTISHIPQPYPFMTKELHTMTIQDTQDTQDTQDDGYITFSTVGMPLTRQIAEVQGKRIVYNYLNNNYIKIKSMVNTWIDREPTPQIQIGLYIEISENNIVFKSLKDSKYPIERIISMQDYYNEIRRPTP